MKTDNTIKKRELKNIILEVPSDVKTDILENQVIFEKNNSKISVKYNPVYVHINKKENKLSLCPTNTRKMTKAVLNTTEKLLKNAFNGFDKEYVYVLSIVFSHFPITAKVEGEYVIISNFLGEKKPRTSKILPNCKVEVKGRDIIIRSIDKAAAGQTAGNLEKATKVKKKDYRMFDDGCYIIEKPKIERK